MMQKLTNKRETFSSGSKGCEAEVVVVFGFEMSDTARVTSLNQMGVALSRARSRLIVRENGIFAPFIYKNEHFGKTGSGQT